MPPFSRNIAAVCIFLLAPRAGASKAVPPQSHELLGSWVGDEQTGSLHFYRLVLIRGGTGVGVDLLNGQLNGIHAVDQWHVGGHELILKTRPLATASVAADFVLTNFHAKWIELVVREATGRILRFTLCKESDVLLRISDCMKHGENDARQFVPPRPDSITVPAGFPLVGA